MKRRDAAFLKKVRDSRDCSTCRGHKVEQRRSIHASNFCINWKKNTTFSNIFTILTVHRLTVLDQQAYGLFWATGAHINRAFIKRESNMCSGLQWTFRQHIVQARMTFPRVRTLSGRSVENREAREKGQGAARDSPRCPNLPGMRTKKQPKAHNSQKSLRLSIPVQKSLFLFVTFYRLEECTRNSCCTFSSKKKESRRCRCDAACKATRKSNRCGNTSKITTVLPPSWWRENSI